MLTPEVAEELNIEFTDDFAFAAFEEGTLLVAAGICELWPERGIAWFAISQVPPRQWPAISRAVKAALVLGGARWPRIEMTIYADQPAALRWAKHLGFEPESYCRKLFPGGRDGWTYVRLSDGTGTQQLQDDRRAGGASQYGASAHKGSSCLRVLEAAAQSWR